MRRHNGNRRRTMPETGIAVAVVSDHAVLRFLERQHGLDVEAIRAIIRDACAKGVRYGATGVVSGQVKFVLQGDTVVTCLAKGWRSRDLRSDRDA